MNASTVLLLQTHTLSFTQEYTNVFGSRQLHIGVHFVCVCVCVCVCVIASNRVWRKCDTLTIRLRDVLKTGTVPTLRVSASKIANANCRVKGYKWRIFVCTRNVPGYQENWNHNFIHKASPIAFKWILFSPLGTVSKHLEASDNMHYINMLLLLLLLLSACIVFRPRLHVVYVMCAIHCVSYRPRFGGDYIGVCVCVWVWVWRMVMTCYV